MTTETHGHTVFSMPLEAPTRLKMPAHRAVLIPQTLASEALGAGAKGPWKGLRGWFSLIAFFQEGLESAFELAR
jgi:hypothetical protein